MRQPGRYCRLLLGGLSVLLVGCSPAPIRPETAEAPRVDVHTPQVPVDAQKALESIDNAIAEIAPGPDPDAHLAASAPTAHAVLARLAARLERPRCASQQAQRSIKAMLRQPDALAQKIERVLPMFDYVLTALEQRELPGQFALIPWAESGFRADPGNRGTVQGLWQFTVSTGTSNGLRIDQRYDGRRAAIESTQAALDHLASLQERFGDWRLSILAYNVGEYGLARALAQRSAGSGALPRGLPAHSYAYLQKITALSCLLANVDRYGVELPTQPFDRLQEVERPTNLHNTVQLARAAGVDLDELLRYNAAFRDGDIADRAPPLILLPGRSAARLVAQSDAPVAPASPASPDPTNSIQDRSTASAMHTVSGGDTLWRIARRYGLALRDLLGWNGLSTSSIIRPGQQLRIAQP